MDACTRHAPERPRWTRTSRETVLRADGHNQATAGRLGTARSRPLRSHHDRSGPQTCDRNLATLFPPAPGNPAEIKRNMVQKVRRGQNLLSNGTTVLEPCSEKDHKNGKHHENQNAFAFYKVCGGREGTDSLLGDLGQWDYKSLHYTRAENWYQVCWRCSVRVLRWAQDSINDYSSSRDVKIAIYWLLIITLFYWYAFEASIY